jgi:TatD DNase family protein
MRFIDTHAHLDFPEYDNDRREVIIRASEACEAVMTIGTDIETSRKSIEIAQESDFIYAAIGIHPYEVGGISLETLNLLKMLAENKKVVAIGETGLDFKLDQARPETILNKESQIELFHAQVLLANEIIKPVIIHARDSWGELGTLLKEWKPKSGVIHSWSGNLEQAWEIVNLGLYISFSGMLTYPSNERLREVAKKIPLERIVLETDAPFLPPQSKRGRRNEPLYIKETASVLAELRGLDMEEIAQITKDNTRRLFSLERL